MRFFFATLFCPRVCLALTHIKRTEYKYHVIRQILNCSILTINKFNVSRSLGLCKTFPINRHKISIKILSVFSRALNKGVVVFSILVASGVLRLVTATSETSRCSQRPQNGVPNGLTLLSATSRTSRCS